MIIEENLRPVERVMENAYKGMKSMAGADMVLGSPIVTNDGITIVPICRITLGFLTGGGEYSSSVRESYEFPFAGGSGTGMSINPIAFLVCDKTKIKIINMDEKSPFEQLGEVIPEIIKGFVVKKDDKKS